MIWESHGKSMFSFERNHPTAFQSGHTILRSPSREGEILPLHILTSCWCVLDFGRSDGCGALAHYCFNLHFHSGYDLSVFSYADLPSVSLLW